MKRRIYKYPLEIGQATTLELPKNGTRLLHVGTQHGQVMLWAEVAVDCILPLEPRRFMVLGTGMDVPAKDGQPAPHVGTTQDPERPLVWHVFEIEAA